MNDAPSILPATSLSSGGLSAEAFSWLASPASWLSSSLLCICGREKVAQEWLNQHAPHLSNSLGLQRLVLMITWIIPLKITLNASSSIPTFLGCSTSS